MRKINVFMCLTATVFFVAGSAAYSGTSQPNKVFSTADHTKFKELKKQFSTGPEVTKACLACHTEAAKQIQHTTHWTWKPVGGVQDGLGKKRVLNNY